MRVDRWLVCMFGGVIACVAPMAQASFHVTQIEQIIGGVNGDTSAQAIQLRMRLASQTQMQNARLVAHDAAGANPVVIAILNGQVSKGSAGDRVLVASASFAASTSPNAVADTTMSNVIPASYLNAGSLTFEDLGGSAIYWRVSWGGAGYTGPTTGSMTNDTDGDFGPAVTDALPTATALALQFKGTAAASSTQNVNDYAQTDAAAVFVNNAGSSFAVNSSSAPPPAMPVCGIFGVVDSATVLAMPIVLLARRRRRLQN